MDPFLISRRDTFIMHHVFGHKPPIKIINKPPHDKTYNDKTYNDKTYNDKTYNKTCVPSKDSDHPVQLPSMARILVYPSLGSLGAVEGTCAV